MIRIEKNSDGGIIKLALSGRIQSNHIDFIRSTMSDGRGFRILDLSEVTLVDLKVIRFLVSCEDEGIEVVQCPLYVREWILRERTEAAQAENS
jgi:hypothetical protein